MSILLTPLAERHPFVAGIGHMHVPVHWLKPSCYTTDIYAGSQLARKHAKHSEAYVIKIIINIIINICL